MSAIAEFAEEVERADGSFAELLEEAPIALAILHRPGTITDFNPAFGQLLGLRSGATSINLVDLVPPENREEIERLVFELFDRGKRGFRAQSPSKSPNSSIFRWTLWPIHAPQELPQNALLMVEDLSSMILADHRLHQAERLGTIGRLAGGIAHDFNNVLTGVLLYCDLLMCVLEPNHRAKIYAEEIRKAGMQATGLVQQLLSVSRPSKSSPRPISLNEIVEGMHNA
jgi:two-component system cell cycle sensor histidine kinase/response regulator CckA